MKLYPVFLNIADRNVVVIGGGDVALRKMRDLLSAEAVVKAVSPEFHEEIVNLSKKHSDKLTLIYREYKHGDLEDSSLVFSATDDFDINKMVYKEAEELNIFINAVDDPPNCSFIIPSWSQHGEFMIAVSTGGASPAMSARLRRELEEHIPDNIDNILVALRDVRDMLKNEGDFSSLSVSDRGELLKRIVNDDILLGELIDSKDNGGLKGFLAGLIGRNPL